MIKRIFIILYAVYIIVFTSCIFNVGDEHTRHEYQRYRYAFIDYFDTVTVILGYARSQEDFEFFSRYVIRAELNRLHQLFDIFNEYPKINNIKTINNNAGISPIEADADIISLLRMSKEAYHITDGLVNIALGPVINIWREAMASDVPAVPCMDALLAANEFTNINNVIIDEEKSTVFLRYQGMSLDVGGIAKGVALELATQKAIEAGFESFTLSIGGDVRAVGSPRNRDSWGVGIEDPSAPGEMIDAVFVTDVSVFSSGDYRRFFIVDDVKFHHIIDPRTLMPAVNNRSVTVIYPDGGTADILSTAAFILEADEAKELLAAFGAEALWVNRDGIIKTTDGFDKLNAD